MLPRTRGVPLLTAALLGVLGACARRAEAPAPPAHPSCFLLHEVGAGEGLRSPSDACATRPCLAVSREATSTARSSLEQPFGVVVDARGEHAFDAPWPSGTVVGAKTGGGDDLQWLVGHVQRRGREWIFVSCVTGPTGDPNAAIHLAADSLRSAGVL